MKRKLFSCIITLLALLSAVPSPAAAANTEPTDYDDYSFTQWVNCNGDRRASSFTSSRDLQLGGTGDNGMRLTFESAGNNQYYIWTNKSYEITYLAASKNTTDAGEHYLYGTTNKNYALKWRLGDDGRLYTTYNSVEYFLWMYSNENPYSKYDAFRLSTDTTKRSYAINYKWMTLTPPHVHPSCGAGCNHEDVHEGIKALAWYGGSSTKPVIASYGTLNAGDYYLDSDLSVSTNFRISGSVRICLNGHKLSFTNGKGGFTVSDTGSLELCDCQGTGSINSFPKDEGSYKVYEANTISIGTSASAVFHDIAYCSEAGTEIDNKGTLTVYGGEFAEGIENYGNAVFYQSRFDTTTRSPIGNLGLIEMEDCDIQSAAGYAFFNYTVGIATISGGSFVSNDTDSDCVYNGGKLSIGGEDTTIYAINGYGIENKGELRISDANISGTIGIFNTSPKPSSNYAPGFCSVSGGTIHGTECGIRNSSARETTSVDGVETTQIAKATLEITGAPSIGKIVLECPDAFAFDYSGEEPVDLLVEISDYFSVGDIVFGHNAEKIPRINLLNKGYGLQAKGAAAVLVVTDLCLVSGHSWMDATCIEPASCSRCGETDGDALGHNWGGWTTALEPTYILPGAEARTCDRCPETEQQAIPATGQAVVDDIRKEQTGSSLTLQNTPGDIMVVVACYLDNRMVFIQDEMAENGDIHVSVPEDTAWDVMKVFFLTDKWIPIADIIEYHLVQSR